MQDKTEIKGMTGRIIDETEDYIVHEVYYEGFPIRVLYEKATGEIFYNSNDAARMLGYRDHEHFIGSDEGLDMISEFQKKNPGVDVFGENGLFVEKKIN